MENYKLTLFNEYGEIIVETYYKNLNIVKKDYPNLTYNILYNLMMSIRKDRKPSKKTIEMLKRIKIEEINNIDNLLVPIK